MSPPDAAPAAVPAAAPAAAPVFGEPWQAQAFALTLELSRRGHFSWSQWTQALAEELQRARTRGELNDGSHYYHHWVAALERLVLTSNLCDASTLQQRKLAWIHAYEHTAHGRPVELARNTPDLP
ncbi:MAG TPA: nitrile hydratase accessory protein [Steroidobacteraceae bacterium]|nr:nitrile hydratase accessory protein [Steroidobacteraceae bacterium]